LQDEIWTWRVNVSNVAVPDAAPSAGQAPLENATIVYKTYDLQWPGPNSLNEKLRQTENLADSGEPRTIGVSFYQFPVQAEYANRYTEDDNGSCAEIFGDDCTAQWLQLLAAPDGQNVTAALEVCEDRLLPLSQGSRGIRSDSGEILFFHSSGQMMLTFWITAIADGESPTPGSNDYLGRPINETESGETFYFRNGGPSRGLEGAAGAVNGTNTTIFDNVLSAVQMIGLTGLPGEPRLLCMRVNLEATDEQASGGQTTPSDNSTSSDSTTSAGMRMIPSFAALGWSIGLAIISIVSATL
jgi:hypothetical protein